jgi:hypothetical protein
VIDPNRRSSASARRIHRGKRHLPTTTPTTERITMTQPINHAAADEEGARAISGGVPELDLVELGVRASRLFALVVMA